MGFSEVLINVLYHDERMVLILYLDTGMGSILQIRL